MDRPNSPMQNQSKAKQNSVLIPDCCNIGVVFRTLVIVNGIVFFALLSRGFAWWLSVQEFIEASTLVEMVTLFSLFTLCGLRRLDLQKVMSDWGQRFLCGVVPALICFGFLQILEGMEWFVLGFPRLHETYAVLSCLFLGWGIQHYFELRTRAYSPALGEARLQALQARIRPHFLFNSLNAVLSLMRTEPRRAETALEDLADLFRVLMRDTRDMSTLKDEIELCKQYLSIEKIRLGDRLDVVWNILQLTPQDLQNAKIPSLLLQPLLENAVHYGVEPARATSTITVDIERALDKMEICIRNVYFSERTSQAGNHMALDNIRQRLILLYDIEAQISANVVGDIFEVKLHFPF